MSSAIKGLLIFSAGVAVGVGASYQFFKTKFEAQANEEIDSVKAAHAEKEKRMEAKIAELEKKQAPEEEEPVQMPDQKAESVIDYASRITRAGYTDYSGASKPAPAEKKDTDDDDAPYVISPDEFGEFDAYRTVSMTYYADKVLADENDDIVEDVENTVGSESLTHFGEYEDDSVFVRNDRLKCDFEILLDNRTYEEVLKTKPHRQEDQ